VSRLVVVSLAIGAGAEVARAESWQGIGEMPLDYRAYVRDFNSGDDSTASARSSVRRW
jgi:hypothetical protein